MSDQLDWLASALANRYRVEKDLGAGGMATVYLAEDAKKHRNVAVKVLHPQLAAVLGADRFLKEIEVTAKLQHPHILELCDSGEADGSLYYVMPYVAGSFLPDKLNREKPLGIDEVLKMRVPVTQTVRPGKPDDRVGLRGPGARFWLGGTKGK